MLNAGGEAQARRAQFPGNSRLAGCDARGRVTLVVSLPGVAALRKQLEAFLCRKIIDLSRKSVRLSAKAGNLAVDMFGTPTFTRGLIFATHHDVMK